MRTRQILALLLAPLMLAGCADLNLAGETRGEADRQQQRDIIENARLHGFKGKWRVLKNQPECKAFAKVPKQKETVTWTGPCVNGIAEGQGTLTFDYFENGEWRKSVFNGTLVAGKMQGRGTKTYYDGSSYSGEWHDDLANGQGTLTFSNGDTHTGHWKRHMADGQGTRTYANGNVYEGQWWENRRHGQGLFRFADGTFCRGVWKEDKLARGTAGTRCDDL